MREIKFRAWYKPKKQMMNPDYLDCDGNCYDWSIEPGDGLENESDFYILMQYTGLKDKLGKEIYEGDRLRFTDKIEWYGGNIVRMRLNGKSVEEINQWLDEQPYEERTVELPDSYEWLLSDEIQRYWEVIGNIYENPELLEDNR